MTDTAQDFGVDFSFEAQHDGATMDADKLFVDATGKSKNFFRRVSSAVKKTVKKAKDRRESRYVTYTFKNCCSLYLSSLSSPQPPHPLPPLAYGDYCESVGIF